MNNSLLLLLFVFLPFAVGFVYYITNFSGMKIISAFVPCILLLILTAMLIYGAFPYIGLLENEAMPFGMALKMDGLSFILILLNNALFFMAILYGFQKPYFSKQFVFVFLTLEGLINGVFLSTDLFNLYVLIELSTVLVTILIMTKKESRSIYDGLIYLMSNLIAMVFFLFGIGYCYKLFGVLDLDSLKIAIDATEDRQTLILPFAFLMTGISLKAALMPLFSWLPRAHAAPSAPTIVSAILSGIFVKTGIYLLIRLQWLFGSQLDLTPLFLILGYTTAIIGFVFAIAQTDIKLVLAYHTISQMGLIVIGLGYNTEISRLGAMYHIVAHGLFKPLLFLVSGILIERYHTRRLADMHRLWAVSKRLSIVLVVAVFSITGAPLFSGAVSKSLIGYSAPQFAMDIISAGTMLSFVKFLKILGPFDMRIKGEMNVSLFQWFALFVMVALSIALGTMVTGVLDGIIMQSQFVYHFNLASKSIRYVILFALCIIAYQKVIPKVTVLTRLRNFDLSFNAMNIALVFFFISVVVSQSVLIF